MKVFAVDQPHLPPLEMPNRFRHDIVYFMTPGDEPGAPKLGPHEYWIRREDARMWLEELVVLVVSPLDVSSKAELELSPEQEAWMQWLVTHDIQHVRVE